LFARSLSRLEAMAKRGRGLAPLSAIYGGWPPLQITTVSVLGLVLIGEGNTTKEGDHADLLRRIDRYLERVGVADHPSMEQYRSWILAFMGLFLAERERVEPDEARRARLAEIARLLASGLKGTRGWCHGLKARGDGYGPFTAVSIWCVAALDAIRDRGVTVDRKALGTGVAVLRRSLGRRGRGARYYADRWTTISPGRTGGVLWALLDHGDAKAATLEPARDFLLDTLWAVPDGHASGMMNLAWGALGSDALGRDARTRFFAKHRSTILAHREESGLFAPRNWADLGFFEDEPKRAPFAGKGTTWPDHAYGKAWATTWMLLTWQVGRGRSVL
jgi:hypothetical protein